MDKLKFGACFNLTPAFLKTHNWSELKNLALECEGFGYDSIWIMDHFGWDTGPNILECWTTLSALAAITTKTRVGTLVLCNSYRHPPLLAKMANTLDLISNGRLDFGIGAGWRQSEYEAFGIPFPSAAIRVAQLEEAIKIIKSLWTIDRTSYEGKFYAVKDAQLGPEPVQKPHPPLWIGAFGEKVMLRIVAEYGDGWNLVDQTPEQYAHKIEVLKKHCRAVGRDINQIMKSLLMPIIMGKTSSEARDKARRLEPPHISGDSFKTRIVGTKGECIERIGQYQKLGMTHFLIELENMTFLERREFAEEIMPSFK